MLRALAVAVMALVAAATTSSAFVLPMPSPTRPAAVMMRAGSPSRLDRRDALSRSAAGAALAILGVAVASPAARAAEEVPLVRDKMGGLLEPYTDIAKVRGKSRRLGRSIDRAIIDPLVFFSWTDTSIARSLPALNVPSHTDTHRV